MSGATALNVSNMGGNPVTGLRSVIADASDVVLTTDVTWTAGDYSLGAVPFDCTVVKAYLSQGSDEGTNGTATIEAANKVGGTDVAVSAALTISAGAAKAPTVFDLSGTVDLSAGQELHVKVVSCDSGNGDNVVTVVLRRYAKNSK